MPYAMLVRDHMNPAPYCLEAESSLSHAASSFRHEGVDCAVVLGDAHVYGVLSSHDLALARELKVSHHDVLLKDFPVHDVYVAAPDAPLARVARAMSLQKVRFALVVQDECVVGLLSWDAALLGMIDASAPSRSDDRLSESHDVRSLLLMEHANIRRVLRRVELAARRVLTTPVPQESDLRLAYESAHTLCTVMAMHLDLEDRVLAPALEALDAWGKVRADRLRSEHAQQTLVLRSYLVALERLSLSERAGAALAALVQQLVESLRKDMEAEEASLLRPELLAEIAAGVRIDVE